MNKLNKHVQNKGFCKAFSVFKHGKGIITLILYTCKKQQCQNAVNSFNLA